MIPIIKKATAGGFTLVELLIVIALISILSVAVLATINPIEQSNKAKDSTVQNDAAEVLNAYERYYANKQSYPWMEYDTGGTPLSVEDAVELESNDWGFGICNKGVLTSLATAGPATCDAASATPGLLIEADELKSAFVGKAEFTTVAANPENGLWTVKTAGSGGSIYVCYIPKAKSNRQLTTKLYCVNSNGTLCKIGSTCGASACLVKPATDSNWDVPVLTGLSAMFRCVPE